MNTVRQPSRASSGFSLIELLVVMAVIALLTAIAVPAISSALRKSNLTKCKNNLYQWGRAVHLYMVDNPYQRFPEKGGDTGGGIKPDDPKGWANVLPPYVGQPSLLELEADGKPMPRPLDGSFWSCPSMRPDAEKLASVASDTPVVAYSYNMWIDHDSRISKHRDLHGPTYTSRLPKVLTLADVRNPSAFVVLGEGAFIKTYGTRSYLHSAYMDYRHEGNRELANLVFADGHVDTYAKRAIYVPSNQKNSTMTNRGGIIWDPEGRDVP